MVIITNMEPVINCDGINYISKIVKENNNIDIIHNSIYYDNNILPINNHYLFFYYYCDFNNVEKLKCILINISKYDRYIKLKRLNYV